MEIKATCDGQCLRCDKYECCPFDEPPDTEFSDWEIDVLEDAEYESVKYRGTLPECDVDVIRSQMRKDRQKGSKVRNDLRKQGNYGPWFDDQAIIRAARKAHGMNERELGTLVGYSHTTVNLWETGRQRMDREKWEKAVSVFPELKGHAEAALAKQAKAAWHRDLCPKKKRMRQFGRRLKLERTRANMTRTKASEFVGCSISTYSYWEQGRYLPTKKNMKQLKELFPALKEETHEMGQGIPVTRGG